MTARRWATTHHAEFGLLFGSAGERVLRVGNAHGPGERPQQVASRRFGGVFAELVARIYREQGFPVPADDDLASAPPVRPSRAAGRRRAVPAADVLTWADAKS